MSKYLSVRWIFLIGIFLAFCLDGSLSNCLSSLFVYHAYLVVVPCLSLLWLVFALFFVNQKNYNLHLEVAAAIVGALCDWYYEGILGVFVFIYPLVMYISRLLFRYFLESFWDYLFVYFIDLIIFAMLSGIAYHFVDHLMGISTNSEFGFWIIELFFSLVFNLLFFSILYFPVRFLYRSCQIK